MSARTLPGDTGTDHRSHETGCHVYGIVHAAPGRVPEGLAGIDDVPVRLVAHADLAAAISDIELDRPPGRRAELLAYSRVLDALAASGAVVPVQFGSIVIDERSVVSDLLVPQAPRFADLLAKLDGRAQFKLSARYDEQAVLSEIVAADPTIARLRRQTRDAPADAALGERVRLGELVSHALQDTRTADADMLTRAVVPYTTAHRVRLGSGTDRLAELDLLVEDDRWEELEQQLENLAESVHGRIRLSLVGPLAPYDFVGSG